MSDRPKTANSIKGCQIDMQEFYSSVIEDLVTLTKRIGEIELRLSAFEIIPERHHKLKSLKFLDR